MILVRAMRSFSSTSAGKKALIMGLSGPAGPPPTVDGGGALTKEKLLAILAKQNKELEDKGITPTMLLVDPTEDADNTSKKVMASLKENSYDVVSIGAGVRTYPEHFLLFENLVNLVHEHAPQARIAFDTGPGDKVESILRSLK